MKTICIYKGPKNASVGAGVGAVIRIYVSVEPEPKEKKKNIYGFATLFLWGGAVGVGGGGVEYMHEIYKK